MAAFEPLLGSNPTVLILGSMPSQISLTKNEYYANSRNTFWWIMSQVFEFDLGLDYHLRSIALVQSGIAVWDVLHDCERPGSLDSSIVKNSEVVNDFAEFFDQHSSLSRVIFNGATAELIFRRHQKKLIEEINNTRPNFEWHRCPSTSPAHASMTKHDKLKAWQKRLT